VPALRRTLGLGTLLPWNISARWCRACSCSSLMISLMVTVFLVIFFVMKDFCGYAETDVILLLPPGAVVVPVLPLRLLHCGCTRVYTQSGVQQRPVSI
jgi:hypothetical protein